MRSFKKKGVGLSQETLVRIALLLFFLLAAVSIIIGFGKDFKVTSAKVYGCWAMNGVVASNYMFRRELPVACKGDVVKEPMNKAQLSKYLTDVWMMYGRGEWDFHVAKDDTVLVSAFTVSEDMDIKELFVTMLTSTNGKSMIKDGKFDISKIEKSDYQYLQKGSPFQTLCIDKNIIPENSVAKLKKGNTYYLYFWDDILDQKSGDKLFISSKNEFKSEEINNVGCCSISEDVCFTLQGETWFTVTTRAIGRFVSKIGDRL
ncbi:hypothetical protein D6777_04635 [Candidatus Woesearchaeota archaeon]|nr:MAG: hypothetical protein D6777_04635 [Candidatus Woesearchaeota archaeon]